MKKLLCIFLLFASFANAQIVNIPDANFKAKLLSANLSNSIAFSENYIASASPYLYPPTGAMVIDQNNNGEIDVNEAQLVKGLDVRLSSIYDLTGIEYFANLQYLNCSTNNISDINITQNTQLKHLTCNNNQITNLDVSQNLNLGNLICDSNQLQNLDISQNSNMLFLTCSFNQLATLDIDNNNLLHVLSCGNNQIFNLNLNQNMLLSWIDCPNNLLTNLDVTNNGGLITLNCSYNQLTSLDVSQNHFIDKIYCYNNQLTSLDVTQNTSLTELYCNNNQLTTLDVAQNTNLQYLYCNNNSLTTLFIKNGRIESQLNFSNNPNLIYICADEAQITSIQNLASSNVVVNSYCSFTPGGNYNTITGSILFDANNNGCDVTDLPQPNIKININSGTNQGATFTNNSGNYTFYTQAGSFAITPSVENSTFFNFSPASATIPFANNNNNTTTQNFCISASGIHPDVEVVIAPITPARPGFDAVYQIVYKNKGNQMLSGNIIFTYDDDKLDFVSATVSPDTQSIGLLNWNYTNLLPFENRSFYLTLNVNSPQETPAVNIGDQLDFNVIVNPIVGDDIPSDNQFAYKQTVVGSFDPNNIECLEGNVVPPSEIGNYLHYIINFENTGTFEAENIVVKTTIDAAKFDVNSLQMLNTSHNAYIKQTGNVVEFIFENIALDTGGHGNVLLKIKSKNDLVSGDAVSKRADIFFDYNAPIDTGLVNTIFQSLSTPDFPDNSIGIYPNPTKSNVNINCNSKIQSVQLYDVQGRLLQTQVIDEVQTSINISEKSNGIYFLKVTSDKGTKVEKLIKE